MGLKFKRVLSGILATFTLGQSLLCNNAVLVNEVVAKGSISSKEDIIHDIEKRAEELKSFGSKESETSFFSFSSNQNADTVDGLSISGYVGLEDNRYKEISVLIFDDNWNTIAQTTTYPNEYFNISVDDIRNFTSTTHVKIECNGYLPRFYKDMGFGSYQLGTSETSEILYFGDTTYNPDADNQWSDEVINYNDFYFANDQIGKRKPNENYDEIYDINSDGVIDSSDADAIVEYYGHTIVDGELIDTEGWIILGGEFIIDMDFNNDNVIDAADSEYLLTLYPEPTYKGDVDFKNIAYMDINENGIIDSDDIQYFSEYISNHDGCNPYNDYIYNLVLTGNVYHDSAMYLENTNLDLVGYSLVVNGNFVFRTQNPHNAMWNDNPGVTLNINNGALAISGQFDFGQANSYDKIIMTEDEGELYIWENWNYITLADIEGLWTAGQIAFWGNTWQVNEASGKKSVYSTEKHSILFGGYKYGQQVIRWDNACETIYNPITNERNTERYLNFGYKENDLCLGVLLSKEYTSENYYFRPELPDYVTLYQDADNNGVNDSIDRIFEDKSINDKEYSENKELLKDFVVSNLSDSPEEEQAIAKLISSDSPYEEENTKSLTEYLYDGFCDLTGEAKDFFVGSYEFVKDNLVELSEQIPDSVKIVYDGVRLGISLSPDPICQSIDFVLSVVDVGYDLFTFECTTEWFVDFGLDVIGVIPYIGAAKEFIKTGKTVDKAVDVAKYAEVDGLTGWINQKGLIKTAAKVAEDSADDVPKVFNSVIDDVIDEADDILKNTDLRKKIGTLTDTVKETVDSIKPETKVNLDKINLDRNVNVIDILIDDSKRTEKKVSETIEKSLKDGKIDEAKFVVDKYSRLKNVFSKVSDISQIIEIVDEYGEEAEKALKKYAEEKDDSQLEYALEIIIRFGNEGIIALLRKGNVPNLPEWQKIENKKAELECNFNIPVEYERVLAFAIIKNGRNEEETIWGYNSNLSKSVSEEDNDIAREYHRIISSKPQYLLYPSYNQRTSRVFTHAEGRVLINVNRYLNQNILDIEQRLNNVAPEILTLYVNKTTCTNCRSYQIELAQALNINKLIMINPNGMQILYDSNEYYYYFTITNEKIIKFYYPDSKIIKLKNAGVIQ